MMSVNVQPPIRRIAHLDMDAFYAACELQRYPQLKDLPVVIGGARRSVDDLLPQLQQRQPSAGWTHDNYEQRLAQIPLACFPRLGDYIGRGVITTATYAARRYGIGSAMGLMKAAKLHPAAILLPVDFERYRHYSQQFKAIIRRFATGFEDRGMDEVFIDFTDLERGQVDGGRVLAQQIQAAIYNATGLTCSIGVAPNKLLAKMASEFDKPNGVSVLLAHELEARIWPLPCRKINGIGPRLDAQLQAHGISTIGQLAACDPVWLQTNFGRNHGAWLFAVAHGQDERPVVTHSEPVSLSRETTFKRDLHPKQDRLELGQIFTLLCQRLAADLQRKGYAGRTIGIKLRFDDFSSVTRDQTIVLPIADAGAIRQVASGCLKRVTLKRKIRLLGVRVGALVSTTDQMVTASTEAAVLDPRMLAATPMSRTQQRKRALPITDLFATAQ